MCCSKSVGSGLCHSETAGTPFSIGSHQQETIAAIEANNDTYCLQKRTRKVYAEIVENVRGHCLDSAPIFIKMSNMHIFTIMREHDEHSP